MIVYLQRNFAEEEQESHGLRNTLAIGGALVGGHFAAKGGLLGRHAQRWAGNTHAWIGKQVGSTSMFQSGQNAAATASAKLGFGRLGWLGASKQEQARAILAAKRGETSFIRKGAGKDGADLTVNLKGVTQADENITNKIKQERQQRGVDRLQSKATANQLTGEYAALNGKQGEEFKKGYEEIRNKRAAAAKPETQTPTPKTDPPATDPAANTQKPGAGDTAGAGGANPNPNPQVDTAVTQQGTGATAQEVTDAAKNAAANQQQNPPTAKV